MGATPNPVADVVVGDLRISSNTETPDQIKANLVDSSEAPKDGIPGDPEAEERERVSKAAAELGKKGGAAAAEKRAKAVEGKDETPAETKADEGEPKKGEPKSKKGDPRHDPVARMQEATREAAEAKRERDRALSEISQLRSAVEELQYAVRGEKPRTERRDQQPQATDAEDPEPQEADYEEYSAWVRDHNRWSAREEWRQHERVRSHAEGVDQALRSATQAARAYDKERPGWRDELSNDVNGLIPSFAARSQGLELGPDNAIADMLLLSGAQGPALMLHLSAHPDELQRLRALRNPQDVVIEMRVMAKTLAAATAGNGASASVSKAKEPVSPVTGSPQAVDSPDELSDDLEFDEWNRRRQALENRRQKAGSARR